MFVYLFMRRLDFSPCGNFIASISIDQTARVWEVATGKQCATVNLGSEW
jgi:WD40 repeat protein